MPWRLQPYNRAGGISGEGVKNLLEASGFATREDLVVREGTQNSVDAHDDVKEHKVRVVIRKLSLTGKRKKQFVKLLELKDLAGIGPLLKTTPKSSPLRALDSDEPLGLLYIEDFNTKGLGGGLTDLKGNYYRLLFLVGDAAKAEDDDETGGSYGYGKSVYSSNASTSTIVSYSVFQPDKKTGVHFARLLGSTFQKPYETDGEKGWTGRGWWGADKVVEDVPDPIANEKAMALAEELGFTPRTKSDCGASMLLVGTEISGVDLSIDRIRAALETWWWPRYIDDRLDVELWDGEKKVDPPRPASRPDLKPYIDCYTQLRTGESSAEVKCAKFNAHAKAQIPMGSIALKAVPEERFAGVPIERLGPGPRRVALIRGPGMVVEYRAMGTERRESFVGVYRASQELNKYLKLAEPKEHHSWDPHARRLTLRSHGTDVVESLIARCGTQVRDFQSSLSPKKEKPTERLAALDKLLGIAFVNNTGPKPPPKPPGKPGPVEIDYPQGATRIVNAGSARLTADVCLRLRPEEQSPQPIVVIPEVVLLQDPDLKRGRDDDDFLAVDVLDHTGKKKIASGVSPQVALTLSKDKWTRVRIISSEYSADWASEIRIRVA